MKTLFALLLLLLPSITHGQHVNLRGAILQDEPKSTSRDLFQVVLLDCITIEQAMGWFGKTADIKCTSNTNCTQPADKCLVEPEGYSFTCGNPMVNDLHFPLCDEPSSTTTPPPSPTTPPQPVPTEPQPSPTSPPAPLPTTSRPTTPPPTPPPVGDGNRDDTDPPLPGPTAPGCLPFDEAYVYYYTYVGPDAARGVNCRSNTECPGEQSCLVAQDRTKFFCGIPNDQDYVLCDDEIRTEPTEPQPVPTEPQPSPTSPPSDVEDRTDPLPTQPQPVPEPQPSPPPPAPTSPSPPTRTCLPFDEAYGYFGKIAEKSLGIDCTSNTNCTNPDKCLVESNGFKFFCGNPSIYDQDYPLCDSKR